MAVKPRKGSSHFGASIAAVVGQRHKHILQRRRDGPDVRVRDAGLRQFGADEFLRHVLRPPAGAWIGRTPSPLRTPGSCRTACKPDGHMIAGHVEPPRVRRIHHRQLLQIVRLAAHDELGHVDVADVRAALRLVHVMRGDKQRHALAGKLEQQIPQLAPRHRINARRRLVEEQHGRAGA